MSLFNRFFGESTNIVTGGHQFGPIGEKRQRIAVNHVCQQIQRRFGGFVKKLSPTVSLDVGACFITITTRKGIDPNRCKQIGEVANALLNTEILYQRYLDDLILLIGRDNLVGSDEGFQGGAREDARAIGESIYNQFGLEGMRYICSMLGELWPHTGLMRSLEFAWNGIGRWAA